MIQYHPSIYNEILKYEYDENDYSMDTNDLAELANQLKSLKETMNQVKLGALKGERIVAKKPLWQQRQDVCDQCEYYQIPQNICSKCGCFMKIKTKINHAKCPLDKW